VETRSNPSALPPIIITGTGPPTTLEETPANVTVITRDELDKLHPHSFIDVLRNVPGIHVDQPGGRGGVSSVYMRGSDPNYTLILMDGVILNDPTNSRGGSVNLSTIDVETIERIEIISGPLSAVYGSDALGGVINIETRKGATVRKAQWYGAMGSYNDYGTGAFASGPFDNDAGYTIQIHTMDDGDPVPGSQYRSDSLVTHLHGMVSDKTEMNVSMRYVDSDGETFPDDSGGPVYAQMRTVDQRNARDVSIGIQARHQGHRGEQYILKGDWFSHDETLDSPGVAPGIRDPFGIPANTSDSELRRYIFSFNGRFNVAEAMQLGFGVDFRHEHGRSDATLIVSGAPLSDRFDLTRDTRAVFVELQNTTFPGLIVQGGWRLDDPQGYGKVSNPRIGASYRWPSSATMMKVSWGKGFKLPSFFALGNPIVGNPELRPETSETIELGISRDFHGSRLRVSGNTFYSRYFNVIDFDEGPPPQLVNRSEVSAQGYDVSVAVQPVDDLSIKMHVSHTISDIKGTDEMLRNRPEWQAGTGLQWTVRPAVTMNLGIDYVGESLDSSVPTGDMMLDGYVRTDMAVTWQVFQDTELSLAIDNVFDTDYEQLIGFPAPGIGGRVSVRVAL